MKELQYLNKYFVKYKFSFLLGILITIVAQIFSLFTPKLISHSFTIIEEFAKDKSVTKNIIQQELISNILLIIATTIIAGFLTFLMRQTLIVMSRHIEFDLKIFRFVEFHLIKVKRLFIDNLFNVRHSSHLFNVI